MLLIVAMMFTVMKAFDVAVAVRRCVGRWLRWRAAHRRPARNPLSSQANSTRQRQRHASTIVQALYGLYIQPAMRVALLLLQVPGLRWERPRVASLVSSLSFGGAHEVATSECREASRHQSEELILYRCDIACAHRNCVSIAFLGSSCATAADCTLSTTHQHPNRSTCRCLSPIKPS